MARLGTSPNSQSRTGVTIGGSEGEKLTGVRKCICPSSVPQTMRVPAEEKVTKDAMAPQW
jgi:hypothetical protein